MKSILFLLLIPLVVFSQESLCEKTVVLSELYYKENYETFLAEIRQLKEGDENELYYIKAIDFNIAYALFQLNKHEESKAVLLQVLKSESEGPKTNFKCDKSVFVKDYEVENLFLQSNATIMQKSLLLLSDIYFELEEYQLALERLEETVNKTDVRNFYWCGNAFMRDILQYEYRNFRILTELDNIEKANQSGISILFLTMNEDLINKVKSNLLKKYSIREIKDEFKFRIEKIKKGFVFVAGNEIEINYIDFFQYKILLWNTIELDRKDVLYNSLAYRILTK
ncbi:hypothetical protein [Flavobacterium sp.]|uniref:hypothetical protein n=1 Tax=Flavobacterium sp. TaxID=239 RepID=UPI004047ABA1